MGYDVDKLRNVIGKSAGPVIIDVRSKHEYKQAHIPGAIHLPFWQMPFRYKSLDEFREKLIVVYCEHGPRAVIAQNVLKSKGFCKVDCLDGHMSAWRSSGNRVER